ncbi:acyl-CoA dehydrogenase family protein [Agromyces larvae]|uniref:Acyl-CoA/acyl-ACP dehydrogenase n=1 Tax=Agromyces larvae TaxID=2929802 RepID=A0ABY4BX50_9MICO|nr:acyl-CoA dehydrogenase family protein [Agromyces larvae]UOE42767.1 acyl-CoA/acyl-ACP dehydrogenase [Agromyces larvae]
MTDIALAQPHTAETPGERLLTIAERVGKEVAGPAAYDVDREARFPSEAFDALKKEGVLTALVPVELGGMGATLTDISNAIRVLARYCSATGAALAMHTIEIFLLLKYGTTPALRALLSEIVDKQLLIANANSEAGLGGDVMRSIAALEPDGDGWRLDKQSYAVSYGLSADLIACTARRNPDAAETDQVSVLFRAAKFSLDPTSGWDTLGLRGTCSTGIHLTGHVTDDDIFPVPFADIANGGGGQLRHVLLTAVWTGLAEAALEEAHAAVRVSARRSIGKTPMSAMRLAEMAADVQAARSTLAEALRRVEAAAAADDLENIDLIMTLRNVKVITTTTAVHTATKALQICSINGFRRGKEYRLERVIRDAHGGLIMVGNDRYLDENAEMLAVRKSI